MRYPNGQKKYSRKDLSAQKSMSFSNRGMTLESDINITNKFYRDTNKALIHKKPTPIQVVNVHYPKRSAAVITEGYFQQPSTTDYNGIYRGKHIDFEAKETKSKTRFPLANIHAHQIKHMKLILEHDGISFLIIRFTMYNETYFMPAEVLFPFWDNQFNGGKKSIAYETIQQNSYLIPFNYQARVNYLRMIDWLYF